MTIYRKLLIALTLVTLLLAVPVMAQDEEAPEMLTASTATELTETAELGEISLDHPEGWTAIQDGSGAIIIANIDILQATGLNIPDDAVLTQMVLVGTSVLALEEGESPADLTAERVLELIRPPEDAELEIEVFENEDQRTVAKIDRSTEEADGYIYVSILNDSTFLLFASTAQPDNLLAFEETLVNIMNTVAINLDATIPEDAISKYEGLEQSVNEEGFPVLGNPDATVEIVEISSFDCPACGSFHANVVPALLELLAEGNAKFVYVPVFGTGSLPGGEVAAEAALCIADQGAFWPYHSALFSWQQYGNLAFAPDRLLAGAENLELDAEALGECLDSDEKIEVIEAGFAYATGTEAFVGTPTLLVNGAPVQSSPDAISAAVADALAGDDE